MSFTFGSTFETFRSTFLNEGGRFIKVDRSIFAVIHLGATAEFSCATANINDTYSDGVGEAIALERYYSGRTVVVPIDKFYAMCQ